MQENHLNSFWSPVFGYRFTYKTDLEVLLLLLIQLWQITHGTLGTQRRSGLSLPLMRDSTPV